MIDLIVHSASQLVTVAGDSPRRGTSQGDLQIIENGAVAVSDGRIVTVGPSAEILGQATASTRLIDAGNHVVLPGFVDAHTHVIFAGDRADEFDMRLRGATYLEIMKAGGGIMSTVRATRAASVEQIVVESNDRLAQMVTHGTTTVECKTGYGLDTATELKMLRAIADLAASLPIDLIPTFLGAHVVPAEYKGREEQYVDLVVNEMLPAVAEEHVRLWESEHVRGAAHTPTSAHAHMPLFCDVFCDDGAFTLAQSHRILSRAEHLGFALKIHADEFANLGGAALAADLGAASADHLMVTPRDEMVRMAKADVVAVLLPGTTFGLGKFDFADGRAFVESNVPVALGTDMNPGTSWCGSMPLMMAIATRYERLTPAEAIVAATLNAAYATGVGDRVGSLQPGKQADILISNVPDYWDLAYRYGANPIRTVIKRGRVISA